MSILFCKEKTVTINHISKLFFTNMKVGTVRQFYVTSVLWISLEYNHLVGAANPSTDDLKQRAQNVCDEQSLKFREGNYKEICSLKATEYIKVVF